MPPSTDGATEGRSGMVRKLEGYWLRPGAIDELLARFDRGREPLRKHMQNKRFPYASRTRLQMLNHGTRPLPDQELAELARWLGLPVPDVAREILLDPDEIFKTTVSESNHRKRNDVTALSGAATGQFDALSTVIGSDFDLPLLGRAAGDGTLIVDMQDVLEYLPRPKTLLRNVSAFALRVPDGAMEPLFFEGDRVFVDPLAVLQPERAVFLMWTNGRGVIRQLVARHPGRLTVRRFKPAETSEVAEGELAAAYRIVGSLDG